MASAIKALPGWTAYFKFASAPAWMKVESPPYDVILERRSWRGNAAQRGQSWTDSLDAVISVSTPSAASPRYRET